VFLGFRGLNRVLGLRGFSERYTGRQRKRESQKQCLVGCLLAFKASKYVRGCVWMPMHYVTSPV
jgi:hypothetical protein